MYARICILLNAMLLAPVVTTGAASADTVKMRPQLKTAPKSRTECPSDPGDRRAVGRVRPGEAEGFNPQPEPPAKRKRLRRVRPGGDTDLNLFSSGDPQSGHSSQTRGLGPLSEREDKEGTRAAPGSKRGFNPQPEPPARSGRLRRLRPGGERGLNPQPEPPSKDHAASPC